MFRKLFVVFALIGILQCQTQGGAPGAPQWTQVTGKLSNTIEVTMARTRDGVLHVVWPAQTGPHKMAYQHATLSPEGAFTLRQPILSDWDSLANAALIVERDGSLRLLFGGVQREGSNDIFSLGSLYTATAPASGEHWNLASAAQSSNRTAYVGPVAATLDRNGTPVGAWAASDALTVQVGLGTGKATQNVSNGCCPYQPALATDAQSGETVVAWYSNVSRSEGIWVKTIAPSAGQPKLVPDTVTVYAGAPASVSLDQTAALAARIGGPGLYVAYPEGYPTYKSVDLWRVGAETQVKLATVNGARGVGISPAPEGRLWVMWASGGRFYAVRSNKAVTRFGAVISVAPPPGVDVTYRTKGEGSAGPLDLFAHVETGGPVATWTTHILPPLQVSATARTAAGKPPSVAVLVSDVGDAVAGANVELNGKTAKTDVEGRAVFELEAVPKPGLKVTVTATGYAPASATVGGR